MIFNYGLMQGQVDSVSLTPTLPYHEIPSPPESYTATTVMSRLIDGLGFRYHWATEGLLEEDLRYTPGNKGRTAGETLDHLYGLSQGILNTIVQKPNIRPAEEVALTWDEKRAKTLENFMQASTILKESPNGDLSKHPIIFRRNEKTSEFPFWNLINGQISDAIYHVGQIVSYRRSSGNPMHPGVNVFRGKTFQ